MPRTIKARAEIVKCRVKGKNRNKPCPGKSVNRNQIRPTAKFFCIPFTAHHGSAIAFKIGIRRQYSTIGNRTCSVLNSVSAICDAQLAQSQYALRIQQRTTFIGKFHTGDCEVSVAAGSNASFRGEITSRKRNMKIDCIVR